MIVSGGSSLRPTRVSDGSGLRPTRVSDGSGSRAARVNVSDGSGNRATSVSEGSGSRATTGGRARVALTAAQSAAATRKCFIVTKSSSEYNAQKNRFNVTNVSWSRGTDRWPSTLLLILTEPSYMYDPATQYCGVANLIGGDVSMILLLSWPKLWHCISTQDLSKAMINTENDSVWYQLLRCYMSTARGPGSGG